MRFDDGLSAPIAAVRDLLLVDPSVLDWNVDAMKVARDIVHTLNDKGYIP